MSRRLDLIIGFVLTACLASVGLAQPEAAPPPDRTPRYFIGADTNWPSYSDDPQWLLDQTAHAYSLGYRVVVWRLIPPHPGAGSGKGWWMTSAVWNHLPSDKHRDHITTNLPKFLADRPGLRVGIYTGYLIVDSADPMVLNTPAMYPKGHEGLPDPPPELLLRPPSITTVKDSAYYEAGFAPLFQAGVSEVWFDAAPADKAAAQIRAMRGLGITVGIEPAAVNEKTDATGAKTYTLRTAYAKVIPMIAWEGTWKLHDPAGTWKIPAGTSVGITLDWSVLRGLPPEEIHAKVDGYLARGFVVHAQCDDTSARYILWKQTGAPLEDAK